MVKSPKVNGSPASENVVSDEKKRQTSKSMYVDSSGETTRSPTKETKIVRFTFDGIDEPVDLNLADLNEEITHLALCQGINIKLQRSYNTAKGNAAQMRQECEDTAQNLLDGIWTGDREGGLRIADLIEALAATIRDEGGTVDDARLASIREKLHDEATREKAKKSPAVQKHLTRIAAEKAAAKAATAAAVVISDTDKVSADF